MRNYQKNLSLIYHKLKTVTILWYSGSSFVAQYEIKK